MRYRSVSESDFFAKRKIHHLPRFIRQAEGVRRAVSRHPDNRIPRTQQRPGIPRALGQFLVDEKIRQLHRMTVHADRLKAVTGTTGADFDLLRQLFRIQPDLERVAVIQGLLQRQGRDAPLLAREQPSA